MTKPDQTEAETLTKRLQKRIRHTDACLVHRRCECDCDRYELIHQLTTALRERDEAHKAVSHLSQQAHLEWTRAEKAERERDEARAEVETWKSRADVSEQGRNDAIQQAAKAVEFHRDMAARFAEDRDAQKHLAREYKARADRSPRHDSETPEDK